MATLPYYNAFAFVTGDKQTAVVAEASSIRLDWLRWVREKFGGTSDAANYTIYRTQLDESGNEIGAREVLHPTPPDEYNSRITVKTNASTNEFYVQIERVVVFVGAEYPDSAIYELEACVPKPGEGVECFSSNLTVYAIGQPPILIYAEDDSKIMREEGLGGGAWGRGRRRETNVTIGGTCNGGISEQRKHWGQESCPLLGGCPCL